ncbi:hypothetical protein [Duganella sp. BuS-21]|uniref:hypothetical protein n=1 Tax=Duganella sp. BuS-21 TaxID=2943848 RepID=UPI0035A57346
MLLANATPAALRAWLPALELKARSLNQVLIPLRDAYDIESETDPFSLTEISALIGSYPGQVRNVFLFAFCTGMRPSKIITLRWGAIDRLGMQVKVEVCCEANGHKDTTMITRTYGRWIEQEDDVLPDIYLRMPHEY